VLKIPSINHLKLTYLWLKLSLAIPKITIDLIYFQNFHTFDPNYVFVGKFRSKLIRRIDPADDATVGAVAGSCGRRGSRGSSGSSSSRAAGGFFVTEEEPKFFKA
jgi:hypothetical protein